MKSLHSWRVKHCLAIALAAFVLCGCGGANRNELDVVPAADRARTALEKALTAWKNGEPCGKIQADSPTIQVVDHVWQSGRKLAAFEVVKAEDKPGPRWFSVKLTLVGAAEPQLTAYAVLGIDPLWVFREEDFEKTSGL
jgi:hypothetical protein